MVDVMECGSAGLGVRVFLEALVGQCVAKVCMQRYQSSRDTFTVLARSQTHSLRGSESQKCRDLLSPFSPGVLIRSGGPYWGLVTGILSKCHLINITKPIYHFHA